LRSTLSIIGLTAVCTFSASMPAPLRMCTSTSFIVATAASYARIACGASLRVGTWLR
jgi:hypothetical protein